MTAKDLLKTLQEFIAKNPDLVDALVWADTENQEGNDVAVFVYDAAGDIEPITVLVLDQ